MERETKKIILTVAVVVIAAASIYTMYTTTHNFVEVAKATHRLGGELVNLEKEDNFILLTFHFDNTSSLDIVLQKMQFNLYANGRYLGNFDMRERTILKPGEEFITIRRELHPLYVEDLEQELEYTEKVLWFVRGGAIIELPFEEMTITISIQEYWVT